MKVDPKYTYTTEQQAIIDRAARAFKAMKGKLSWYDAMLADWPKAEAGPKPVTELVLIHCLSANKRPGREPMAGALALRPCGYTDGEHKAAFALHGGTGPAHNYLWHKQTGLRAVGLVDRLQGPNSRNWLQIMPKGFKVIEAELAKLEASQPVKKPAKPRSKPTGEFLPLAGTEQPVSETPISEAPTVNEAPVADLNVAA